MAADIVGVQRNYQSLSVRDLLEARDLYHYHLMNKTNVVGTAIGLYLIRNADPWPTRTQPDEDRRASASKGERNLGNSGVRDYSWPCLLVFVKKWVDEEEFHANGELHPEEMVPKTLYLPDGRMVPVCIVKVDSSEGSNDPLLSRLQWPKTFIGGGYPLLIRSQHQERHASVGCLVSDGHSLYALTNRHVAGSAGERVFTILRGKERLAGRSSRKQLTRKPFTEVYPGYSGSRTFSNLDIGLVELDNANDWTSEISQIGPIGGLADLHESNTSLALINAEVIAFGAASGYLEGRICALFYRYKSVGGYDYVADFLIAPMQPEKPQTQSGDSGTVWLLKPAKEGELPRPIAIEWGAQAVIEGAEKSCLHLALATSLSNACKLLDVELVQAHNTGAHVTWGATGHYIIAAYASKLLQSDNLQKFINANVENISYPGAFDPKEIEQRLKDAKTNDDFVPLADVPDIIWKNLPSKVTGGRDTNGSPHGSTGPEHPNHYADVDGVWPEKGKTLIDLCAEDLDNVNVDFWREYYTALGKTQNRDQGLLPFRAAQIYNAMVEYVKAEDLAHFLAAAGVLSHYIGDACQPLHGSIYSDGYSDQAETITGHHQNGEPFDHEIWPGQGVHSTYETKMVDDNARKLFDLADGDIGGLAQMPLIAGGMNAAKRTVELMKFTQDKLPPKRIIDTYIAAGGKKNNTTSKALFDKCGKATAQLWIEGARTLACLWDSAWSEGHGDDIAKAKLTHVDPGKLQDIYSSDTEFIPSYYMKDIDAVLTEGQPAHA